MGEVAAAERSGNYLFWSEFAGRPGAVLGHEHGAIFDRSGVPFASYNGVLGVGCNVDAMPDRVRAWDVAARWLISTASSGDIETEFARRGLTLTDEYLAMLWRPPGSQSRASHHRTWRRPQRVAARRGLARRRKLDRLNDGSS